MIRHLVLCGLGPGHLRLLAYLARQAAQKQADIGISLLTRQHRYISDAALLKTVGTRQIADRGKGSERITRAAAAEAELLEAMVQKSGVRWIDNTPQALDMATQTLLLDDGRTLRFDWLSVEPEPVQNRDLIEHALPGSRANGLFVRPREAFCKLWPQVQALAATRPLRFAVVLNALPAEPQTANWASEKSALELAFALRHAFQSSAVTLITGGAAVGEGLAPALQDSLRAALKKRHITVLPDAAVAIAPSEISLQSGTRLACDVPLVALAPGAPGWLLECGLALDARGQVQIDRNLRTSHPTIFVHTPTAPVHTRRLFQSLRSVLAGRPLAADVQLGSAQANSAVHRIDCGGGYSWVAWRNWAMESRRLWPNPW